ncbi:MAG: hypothetical protein AAF399_20990, partial [Bacteroidota bacterium]
MPRFFGIFLACCWLTACAQPSPSTLSERVFYPPIQVGSSSLLFQDSSLLKQVEVLEDRIILYADSASKTAQKPEVVIFQEEYAWFRQAFYHLPFDSLLRIYQSKGSQPLSDELWATGKEFRASFEAQPDSSLPLAGLRVAIDPGHTAGNLAVALLEGKYVKMKPSRYSDYEPIAFWEANLTLATAKLIQRELEAQGAEVFLTREKPGQGALGLTYPQWKRTDLEAQFIAEEMARGKLDSLQLDFFLNEVPERIRMSRFFTQQDLRERARVINAFQPHLTLIIHYNIHGPSWDARDADNNLKPEQQNYLMAFVPGSFLRGELAFPADRLALVRMLLTEDVPQSVALSQAFVKQSVKHAAPAAATRSSAASKVRSSSAPAKSTRP